MSDEAKENLERVRGELENAAAEGNQDAGELAGHVDAYLASSEDDDDHGALLDRLHEGVLRFELSHPRLSHALQGVVDSMTASGI